MRRSSECQVSQPMSERISQAATTEQRSAAFDERQLVQLACIGWPLHVHLVVFECCDIRRVRDVQRPQRRASAAVQGTVESP